MAEHPQVRAEELEADIDEQVLPLVRLLNSIPGVTTLSSCQGDPGPIEVCGGCYGHVAFRKGNWQELGSFCFDTIFPLFVDLWDDVRVEIDSVVLFDDVVQASGQQHWEGWVRFRNEALPIILSRLEKRLLA